MKKILILVVMLVLTFSSLSAEGVNVGKVNHKPYEYKGQELIFCGMWLKMGTKHLAGIDLLHVETDEGAVFYDFMSEERLNFVATPGLAEIWNEYTKDEGRGMVLAVNLIGTILEVGKPDYTWWVFAVYNIQILDTNYNVSEVLSE